MLKINSIVTLYFILQIQLVKRKLIDFGVHPLLAIILFPAIFVFVSMLLFSKTEYAGSIYVLIALSFCTSLSEKKRNEFLKFNFSISRYRWIRFFENFIVVLPFFLFLAFRFEFIPAFALLILSTALALLNYRNAGSIVIPTPFSRKPFEFSVGFRNSFFLLIFAYFIAVMSVLYNNFNLGVFALILIFILSLSFYLYPENEYFVWSFSMKAPRFIFEKIKIAIFYLSILSAPVLVVLAIFFSQSIQALLLVQLLGYASIIVFILVKYAAYPSQVSLPQLVILGLGLYLPPALFLIAPVFYMQAVKRLNEILE